MFRKIFFSLTIGLTSTTLFGAESASGIEGPEGCVQITDVFERVSCYDSFFRENENDEVLLSESQVETASAVLSLIDSRILEEQSVRDSWFSITPHKPNYILPFTYNFSADYSDYGFVDQFFSDDEIKFQLSLKTRLLSDLWRGSSVSAGYTQQSFWQLYAEEEISAPFRETNHEPELMWDIPLSFDFLGFQARQLSLAFNHQSNGRAEPLSRSWNRVTAEIALEKYGWVFSAKSWSRVDDPKNDDNPNIEDYMGRLQLGAAYKWQEHTFALGIKNGLGGKQRSGVELNWTFPLFSHLKGFVQLYSGYGENLIDMENYNNRLGVGFVLTDWL